MGCKRIVMVVLRIWGDVDVAWKEVHVYILVDSAKSVPGVYLPGLPAG
jgi:hypothetical protein